MSMDGLHRTAYRVLGRYGRRAAADNPHLGIALERAHITLRPEVYLATLRLLVFISLGLGLLALGMLVGLQVAGVLGGPAAAWIILVPLPFVMATTAHFLGRLWPDLRARGRARDIDVRLPYALNYVSTMAAAGASPDAILRGLSGQDIYGEVAQEAAWLVRDMDLLGADLLTALGKGIDRSPSAKWQDLLQGVVTVLTGGGDLKAYFASKADQFLYENRQDQKKFLDSLGVLAESFVVVVAAAPLFLLVILSVMGMLGGSADHALRIGYMMILLLLPAAQAGFAYTIHVMTPEA